MHYIFLLILLFNFGIFADGPANSSPNVKRSPRRRTIVSIIFSNTTVIKHASANRTATCKWLRGYKHQNRLCRKRKGFPEALQEARKLAVSNCEEQFRYDRWNCSHKKQIFKKIFRETAFLYSISSSAIMYSVAKACSVGKLLNCRCAQQENGVNPKLKWKWGGCGDNTKQAKKIARKFLQVRQKGDGPHNVLNYNSLVGLKIVADSERKVCQCHGVSGSCVMKTCWKSLISFTSISEKLKESYHSAIQHSPMNTVEQTIKKINQTPGRLLYLDSSPNFCQSTAGRRCKDPDNCATLCCGRGFDTQEVAVHKYCRCKWQNDSLVELVCDNCSDIEEVFTCK